MKGKAKYIPIIVIACLFVLFIAARLGAFPGLSPDARPETDATTETATEYEQNEPDITAEIEIPDVFEASDLTAYTYTGEPYVAVNGNEPYFIDSDYSLPFGFEYYSPLDSLGRCGVTMSVVGKETMPTESRGEISSVYPTGWKQNKYDTSLVDGGYIYNRAHLLGFQLTAENANDRNLITGTRYFNVEGMLPFENMVADYVKETSNHVLYRVTPVFDGNNLVANGVLMEADSVEDDELEYCVFVFNVQPGITIDYATGENWISY